MHFGLSPSMGEGCGKCEVWNRASALIPAESRKPGSPGQDDNKGRELVG